MRGDRVEAARERGIVGLDHLHGNAGIGEAHGDAAAHGAGADHRGTANFGRLDGGDLGKLRRFALGEEDVALCLRFFARDEFEKQRALARQRPLDRRRERAPQRLDGGGRRLAAARALERGAGCGLEFFGVGAIGRELLVALFRQHERPARLVARERNRRSGEIALDDGVDRPASSASVAEI